MVFETALCAESVRVREFRFQERIRGISKGNRQSRWRPGQGLRIAPVAKLSRERTALLSRVARETNSAEPSPYSRRFPANCSRAIQLAARGPRTRRNNPPPSLYLPGSFSAAARPRAVSFPIPNSQLDCEVVPPFIPPLYAERRRTATSCGDIEFSQFSEVLRGFAYWDERWRMAKWCGREELELPRPFGHSDLNAARLPVPPRPHVMKRGRRSATATRQGAASSKGPRGAQCRLSPANFVPYRD